MPGALVREFPRGHRVVLAVVKASQIDAKGRHVTPIEVQKIHHTRRHGAQIWLGMLCNRFDPRKNLSQGKEQEISCAIYSTLSAFLIQKWLKKLSKSTIYVKSRRTVP